MRHLFQVVAVRPPPQATALPHYPPQSLVVLFEFFSCVCNAFFHLPQLFTLAKCGLFKKVEEPNVERGFPYLLH